MCQSKVQSKTEIRVKAPKRPYKNFAEFCARYLGAERVARGQCPCLVCYGREWVPVEGKPKKCEACEACKGTGQGTYKACIDKYREKIGRWEVQVVLYKTNVGRRLNALAKLTDNEIAALKDLGI